MRFALLVLVGCGRIAFEPLRDDGAVMDDGGARGDGQAAAPTVYLVSSNSPDTELFTVKLETGQLTLVGTFSGLGTVGGLAYWDANLIYATSNNSLIRITLPAEYQDRQPVRELVDQLMGKNPEHRFNFIQSRASAVSDDEIDA